MKETYRCHCSISSTSVTLMKEVERIRCIQLFLKLSLYYNIILTEIFMEKRKVWMCKVLRCGNGHVKVSKASNPRTIDKIIIHTGQVQEWWPVMTNLSLRALVWVFMNDSLVFAKTINCTFLFLVVYSLKLFNYRALLWRLMNPSIVLYIINTSSFQVGAVADPKWFQLWYTCSCVYRFAHSSFPHHS